jgi:succinate dehydrogenase / fumarate reductase flavoprotein subunit
MSESARGEGGRVWVPRNAGDARDPRQIPTEERLYFLEETYPAYFNRDWKQPPRLPSNNSISGRN